MILEFNSQLFIKYDYVNEGWANIFYSGHI